MALCLRELPCVRAISLFAAAFVFYSGSASATFIASTTADTTGNTAYDPQFAPQTVGWDFTVSQDVVINALGIWDDSQNGLMLSHDIAIYDLSGPLVASASISAGSGDLLLEGTRWVQITEVTLLANVTYTIMADYMCVEEAFGGDRCLFGSTVLYDPLVSQTSLVISDFYESIAGDGLGAHDHLLDERGYLGPNFGYIEFGSVPVPEPGMLSLLGAGLLGLGVMRRRRAS